MVVSCSPQLELTWALTGQAWLVISQMFPFEHKVESATQQMFFPSLHGLLVHLRTTSCVSVLTQTLLL